MLGSAAGLVQASQKALMRRNAHRGLSVSVTLCGAILRLLIPVPSAVSLHPKTRPISRGFSGRPYRMLLHRISGGLINGGPWLMPFERPEHFVG